MLLTRASRRGGYGTARCVITTVKVLSGEVKGAKGGLGSRLSIDVLMGVALSAIHGRGRCPRSVTQGLWAGYLLVARRKFSLTNTSPSPPPFFYLEPKSLLLFRYTEAVEVLYGTNTFHISNNPTLLRLLPELLLPQRREAIRSVELKYDFFRIYSPIDPPMTAAAQEACHARLKAFCSMIDAVPKAFPCLRQLHVSPRFEWFHYRMDREDCVARWKADVFPHLAAIVSQLDALEECVVTVGYLVAEALVSEALIEGRPWCHKQYRGVGRLETDDGDGQWEYRAWMPVSKCVEGVEGQAVAEEEGTGKGFWTVMGEMELDTNAPVCFAF